MRLFHVSEEPGITHFLPRPAGSRNVTLQAPVVWAVAESNLWTYLVPRDCPRVVFAAAPTTTPGDIELFLHGETEKKVMAIEATWFERCHTTTLVRYEFDPEHFVLYDPNAQYYVSTAEQRPIDQRTIAQPLIELVQQHVELRITPALWELRERIYRSSLNWSFIRMRNAQPPIRQDRTYLPV